MAETEGQLGMKTAILLPVILLLCSASYAQESAGETQSLRCSALARIHTVITTPAAFNESITNMAIFYADAYAAFRESRTNASSTNGEIRQRGDTIESELRKTWKSKPEIVVSEMALCNSWRAAFAEKIPAYMARANTEKATVQGIVQLMGIPPTSPAFGQVEKWRPIVAMAFNAWAETGSQTSGEVRDSVKKQLQEALKKQ